MGLLTSENHSDSDSASWQVVDTLLLNCVHIKPAPSQQLNRNHLLLWVIKCYKTKHVFNINLLIIWVKKRQGEGGRDYLVSKVLSSSSVLHLYYHPAPAQCQLLEAFQFDNLPSECDQLYGLCTVFYKYCHSSS